MRMVSLVFGLMLSMLSSVSLAGSGHDHGHGHSHDPVSQVQAEAAAAEKVAQLVAAGKLDASWKDVSVAKAEQKMFGGQMEWVVSFKNTAVTDTSKQTLYVFLTVAGEYLAANYTGQ